MKLALAAAIVVLSISGIAGCGSDDDETSSAASPPASNEAVPSRPLDEQAARIEAEGFGVTDRGADPGGNQDGFRAEGNGLGPTVSFQALYWDDPNVARTEFDAISQVFAEGALVGQGVLALAGEDHIVYEMLKEDSQGKLTPAERAEFNRLVKIAEGP